MMQNLQPVGTVDWSDGYGDSWIIQEEINEEMGETVLVSVAFGEDYIVVPDEDGDWAFVGALERDIDYFFDRTAEMAKGLDEFFILEIAGEGDRYLYTKVEE